jgi:hypothetical protein
LRLSGGPWGLPRRTAKTAVAAVEFQRGLFGQKTPCRQEGKEKAPGSDPRGASSSKSDLDRASLKSAFVPLAASRPFHRFALRQLLFRVSRPCRHLPSGQATSAVLIPVKLHSAVSTEEAISFRMIHEPSGKPIRYVKGIPTEQVFEEVPEDEIVKGYEHAKGHHVLIKPKGLMT